MRKRGVGGARSLEQIARPAIRQAMTAIEETRLEHRASRRASISRNNLLMRHRRFQKLVCPACERDATLVLTSQQVRSRRFSRDVCTMLPAAFSSMAVIAWRIAGSSNLSNVRDRDSRAFCICPHHAYKLILRQTNRPGFGTTSGEGIAASASFDFTV